MRIDPALGGAENMRLDMEALEAQRGAGAESCMRVYQWAHSTVSFGRLQDEATARAFAEARGAQEIVRRPTGGGLVWHDKELSFSLAWRADASSLPREPRALYRAIHGHVREVLSGFRIETNFAAPCGHPRAPGVCFQEPVLDDLLWRGQKVAGGALRITRWGRLYQGDVRTDVLGLSVDKTAEALLEKFQRVLSEGRFGGREGLGGSR